MRTKAKTTELLITALLFLGIFSRNIYAQFSLSGEIRPRTEYRHGYQMLADSSQEPAIFTEQRTRLNFEYETEGLKTRVSLQDVRVWGSQKQLVNNDGMLTSVHEAWAEALISKKLSLKFGRQELVYDDHRIFGNVNWTQQARSHDALLFKYTDSTLTIHIGGAYNQDKARISSLIYTVPNSYKALQFLWLHKDFSKNLGLSLLFLNNGQQPTFIDKDGTIHWKDNYSQTAGYRVTYKKDKLFVFSAFYYQTGVAGDWNNTKINALYGNFDIGYKIFNPFTLTLGLEYLSGTSQTDTANKENNSFTPFYGTNHKFNGFMDLFYVGNHINSVGLQDFYIKAKYENKKFFTTLDIHYFYAAADIMDVDEFNKTGKIRAIDPYLGTEFDFLFAFNLSKYVSLKAGYSQLLASKSFETIRGGDYTQIQNWAWLMLTAKPQFISKK